MELSPAYFQGYLDMRSAAMSKDALLPKEQELICVALAAACTHIHEPSIRAHNDAALAAGASAEEIFEAIGVGYLLGIHSVTGGAPILFELMEELGISQKPYQISEKRLEIKEKFVATRGFWPERFTFLLRMDPVFFEAYTDFSSFSSKSKVLEPKMRELIICAIDASTTHLHTIGIKVHMRNALKLGATPDQVIQMLELTSLVGMHGVLSSVPILRQALPQSCAKTK